MVRRRAHSPAADMPTGKETGCNLLGHHCFSSLALKKSSTVCLASVVVSLDNLQTESHVLVPSVGLCMTNSCDY